MTSKAEVESALANLQRLVQRPPSQGGEAPAMRRQLPLGMTDGELTQLGLLKDEVLAMEAVEAALRADLRFEHIRRPDDEIWQFVAECWADPNTDHLPKFIEEHTRELLDRLCFIPVEHLSVEAATEVLGIRLLATDDPEIPVVGPHMSLEKPIGCVAVVAVRGTDHGLMAVRARFLISHALRVMRIALREHRGVHDRQLRFRLGTSYAFDDNLSGWDTRDDVAYDLGFSGELITLTENQPVSRMPPHPTTDIGRKADLALRWMERAWMIGDPLVALLYLFFALEALLGDTSEGLKGHALAFRQAMLSHIVDGNFSHPSGTWFLYDKVRSGAVHGEDAPDVDWGVVQSFAWDVRRTLNQYLTLAEEQGFVRRGRLLRFLNEHEDHPQLMIWLRQGGDSTWMPYLDELGRDPK